MNPKSDNLPGLRKPTEAERKRIEEFWSSEIRKLYRPKSGKLARYAGIFFLCTAFVNVVRGSDAVMEILVSFAIAAACLFFSRVGKNSARQSANQLQRLKAGDYMVAPVNSTKILYATATQDPAALVKVCLPDGEPLSGSYPIPFPCVEDLLKQKIHNVPLLLIQIPGDSEILAITVK